MFLERRFNLQDSTPDHAGLIFHFLNFIILSTATYTAIPIDGFSHTMLRYSASLIK